MDDPPIALHERVDHRARVRTARLTITQARQGHDLLVAQDARTQQPGIAQWWVAMDARMDEVYAAHYRIDADLFDLEGDDGTVAREIGGGVGIIELRGNDSIDDTTRGALGIGIFCGDESHCEIEDNAVSGTRADANGGRSRAGWDVVAHYKAHATLHGNTLGRGSASFVGASLEHR